MQQLTLNKCPQLALGKVVLSRTFLEDRSKDELHSEAVPVSRAGAAMPSFLHRVPRSSRGPW